MDTNIDRLLGYLTLDIVDLKYLDQELGPGMPRYLYFGIDLLSRWKYAEFQNFRSPLAAKLFLDRLIANTPFEIKKIFTDNAIEFTASPDHVEGGEPKKETFSQTCVSHSIIHVLLDFSISDLCEFIKTYTFRLLKHEYFQSYPIDTFEDFEDGLNRIVEDWNADIQFNNEYLTQTAGEWNAYLDQIKGGREDQVLREMVEAWDAYFDPPLKDWPAYLQYLTSQIWSQKDSKNDG